MLKQPLLNVQGDSDAEVFSSQPGGFVAPEPEKKVPPKNAAGQEFNRKTTKYWVHADNVAEVKAMITKHLPEYKFDDTIENCTQSLYLDNPNNFHRYYDRMMMIENGMLFRYRWYGQGLPKVGFMEQKIRRFGYLGATSVKRRFKLRLDKADAYIKGEFIPTADNSDPPLNEAALKLSDEIRGHIQQGGLVPVIRTAYNRSCYQKAFDDPVRVSFDEQLQFSMCRGCRFYASDPRDLRLEPHEVYNFPHAILEIKVRLTGEGRGMLPDWCQSLLDRQLAVPCDKFSKFNSAVAILWHNKIDRVPYYFPLVDQFTAVPTMQLIESTEIEVNPAPQQQQQIGDTRKGQVLPPPKGDNKTFMANERTFLKWVRVGVVLALLGVALLQPQNLSDLAGAPFVIGGLLTIVRALYIYFYRAYQIRTLGRGSFYDGWTPFFMVTLFVCGVLVLSWATNNYTFFVL